MRLIAVVGLVANFGIKITIYSLISIIVFLFFYERIKLISNMTDSVEGNSLLNNLKTGRLIKPSATVSNRAAPHPVALAPGAISNSFDTNATSGGNPGKKRRGEEEEEEEEEFDDGVIEENGDEDDFDGGEEDEDLIAAENGKPAIIKGILKSQPLADEHHQPMNLDIVEEITSAATKNGKRKKKSAGEKEKECTGCQQQMPPTKKRTKKSPSQPNGSTAPQIDVPQQAQMSTPVNGGGGDPIAASAAYNAANVKCGSCSALQKCIKGLLKTVENFVAPY